MQIFNFNGATVRTVTLAGGEPGFVGKDVAERLGYADTSDAIKRHCRGSVIRLPLQTAGGLQQVRVLTEPDVMRLIVSSKLPEAEAFERWVFEDVLPSLRKTGGYTMNPPSQAPEVTALQLALVSAQMSADILRLEGSARVGMLRQAHELAGASHLLPMLPVYAIDAPNGSSSDIGSEPTASLSALLVEHGCRLTAVAANKRLEALGYLEHMQRPSSRGGVKKYWSVTKTGAKYGKNATSDRNQRETQPVWYKATAAAMIQEISRHNSGAAAPI